MKVGSGGNLGLSSEYHKKLFGPLFYSRCNRPLTLSVTYGKKGTARRPSMRHEPELRLD